MITKIQELGSEERLVMLVGFLVSVRILTYTHLFDLIPYNCGYVMILIGLLVVLYGIARVIIRKLRTITRQHQIIGGNLTR